MTTSSVGDDVRLDVTEVLVRYATGIDQKDWRLLRSCFVTDCHADYGDVGTWQGADAITDYMTLTHPDHVRTLHRITNVAIRSRGDAVEARSYVDVIYVDAATGGGVNAIGSYDDELVRTTDGWRIARRRYTMVHMSPIGRRSRPS